MRAIVSVSEKTGLEAFARSLADLGWELVSTGGTRRALEQGGVPVRGIEDLTGFPEILDGRVKTLHPAVHAGLLARRDLPDHLAQLERHGLGTIDLVAVNLYPFVQTVARPEVALEDALEQIDIGGPTLLRAAAKNFPWVLTVADPTDYGPVIDALRSGTADLALRRNLAAKAFQHVAYYDTAVAAYLRGTDAAFPQEFTVAVSKAFDLRYGENPHQQAAFYRTPAVGRPPEYGVATAQQLQGKELSFNNIADADAAWGVVCDFAAPTVAVIKHANPCGLASHDDLSEAYRRAFAGDPVSAYGGIVACNRPVTEAMAREMGPVFYEVVIAPAYEPGALETLRRKRDLRILATGGLPHPGTEGWDLRRVRGGYLVQTPDALSEEQVRWRTVTRREPTPQELADLLFAWRAVKHVKSNAIVLAQGRSLLGVGPGQPNRVTSVQLAVQRAGDRARGSVLASDAFFPFPDGVEAAAAAGATAIIQPGGSIRDEESIRVCDEHGLAMVFTGTRHFRH
ncbi:MAG: bifunctional phosphoribosylaminoimidazolecarboxamide formyltransferase/IMP cyclohydrolase [Chloroflexi bacterium]|nr:bifunctional phosphoribosylaminoimidazolecarboxamide formyltransferase/IMP cyclohydrolase [Chloroflexota bacterium]